MKSLYTTLVITSLLGNLAIAATKAKKDINLTVHEWGTFTAVQGSNGKPLPGMSHEEEALPSFVGSRSLLSPPNDCTISKGIPICSDARRRGSIRSGDVTQKMETPVVYFHADNESPISVDLKVDFPKGIISQYYPNPASFLPALDNLTYLGGGSTTYQVSIHPRNSILDIPTVASGNVYGPAREARANYISSRTNPSEMEKFIFYRGLGDFETNLHVSSQNSKEQETLLLENKGEKISSILLLSINESGNGNIEVLNPMEKDDAQRVPAKRLARLRSNLKAPTAFQEIAESVLVKCLRNEGLYEDEALAMARTWKQSYFKNPGLRVLYVLSRAETDNILPLSVTSPDAKVASIERALVGRIEVFTEREEETLYTKLQNGNVKLSELGRFAEPKLRRLLEIARDRDFGNEELGRKIVDLLNQAKRE